MPACDMFVPTREQYIEACRERDQAREVVKAAVRFFDAYDLAGGLAATGAQAEALDDAIDAFSVPSGAAGGIVRPWWVTTMVQAPCAVCLQRGHAGADCPHGARIPGAST